MVVDKKYDYYTIFSHICQQKLALSGYRMLYHVLSVTTIRRTVALALAFFLSFGSAVAEESFDVMEKLGMERGAQERFIVLLKEGTSAPLFLDEMSGAAGFADVSHVFQYLGGFAATLAPAQVALLRENTDVVLIEKDEIVYAFSHRDPQTLPTGINRVDAEKNPTAKIDGLDERVDVDIAILDTGIQSTHPDLNVFKLANFSRELSSQDLNGHGTHVAGTAAAKDNGVGVVGVAPGARLWSVKVLDRWGSGFLSDVIAGIDYVAANAALIEVANMSLGCECQTAAMDSALTRATAAGVVFVVAAGNSAKDAATFSPANHPDVLAVSAIADFNGLPGGGAPKTCRSDIDDTFADFSNFGSTVDIAAPGVCITSTWKSSSYKTISGTSMASPHAAGVAALWIARTGKPVGAAGVAAVRDALKTGAFPQAGAEGFSGDPDSFKEPLLNATSL